MAITFFHLRTWVVATIVTIAGFASAVELLAKAQTQSSCSVENKSQYYREFVSADEGDAKGLDKALSAAKRYLACLLTLENNRRFWRDSMLASLEY